MKFFGAIKAAMVGLFGSDEGAYPRVKVLYLGKETEAVAVQPYGLFAGPVEGGLAILLQQQGQESSKYAICMDPVNRFKGLDAGEVLIGNTISGSFVKFLNNGTIQIDSINDTISIDGNITLIGNLTVTGNVTVTGNITMVGDLDVDGDIDGTGAITVTGDSTASDHISGGISFLTHVHPENDSGGPTGPPQ